MDNQAIEPTGSKETRPERKHLTDLDQIIHRHLNDEHDKITEEDIRNAVIGFPSETVDNNIESPLTSPSGKYFSTEDDRNQDLTALSA